MYIHTVSDDEKISGIYVILNRADGKMYVGSSYDISHRWRKHRESLRRGKHHSPYLQRAWNKHGEKAFAFIVVERVEAASNQDREQIYLDSGRYVYNTSKSARSPTPAGSKLPDSWRLNAAAGYKEKFLSRVLSGEIPHPHKGRVHGVEVRKRVAAGSLKNWEKNRDKIIAAQRAVPISSAQRSDAAARLWADPVYRERAIASRKGRAFNKGYRCTPAQVENRRRAARISNMKRSHGDAWRGVYASRYPQFAHEASA